MHERYNDLGQPIGMPVPGWSARPVPPRTPMTGRYCTVEPLDAARHAAQLYAANAKDAQSRNKTYLSSEPFASFDDYRRWVDEVSRRDEPLFHAVVDAESGSAVGVASFMRIDRPHGVIEIGHIDFSPLLQRTTAATEAISLMLGRAFDELGYRRCEWKCDSLNAPSRAAATRFGFRFEGTFRQAIVYKGRNRDTAWYSIIDSEWPALRETFARWLAPSNFEGGVQKERLQAKAAATRTTG